MTETISRINESQPRPKYIFNKCGTNIYFFTLQRFCPSPSPNFKNYKYIIHKYRNAENFCYFDQQKRFALLLNF